jgi:hypothetical protein
MPSVGRSEKVSRSSDSFHDGAEKLFRVWRVLHQESGIYHACGCCGDATEFSPGDCSSETPSTLVVAPISFFCPCGRDADHVRSPAVLTRPKGEAWDVAFALVSE